MELCSPELKYFVFFFLWTSNFDFGIRTGKTPSLYMDQSTDWTLRNDGSIPDSGNIYFTYIKFPDLLWGKMQPIQAYG